MSNNFTHEVLFNDILFIVSLIDLRLLFLLVQLSRIPILFLLLLVFFYLGRRRYHGSFNR